MKYFLDTEFIEGFTSRFIGDKERHFIELISIGIVDETGRSFYAISNEFKEHDANDWVKENVIAKLPSKKEFPNLYKSEEEIKEELLYFFCCAENTIEKKWYAPSETEIYAYYADYDWVVFCSLFGTMMDLPQNFPMFCMDLKQMMEERKLSTEWKQRICPDPEGEHDALVDANWNKKLYSEIIKAQSYYDNTL
jgi:hypothetical protein